MQWPSKHKSTLASCSLPVASESKWHLEPHSLPIEALMRFLTCPPPVTLCTTWRQLGDELHVQSCLSCSLCDRTVRCRAGLCSSRDFRSVLNSCQRDKTSSVLRGHFCLRSVWGIFRAAPCFSLVLPWPMVLLYFLSLSAHVSLDSSHIHFLPLSFS